VPRPDEKEAQVKSATPSVAMRAVEAKVVATESPAAVAVVEAVAPAPKPKPKAETVTAEEMAGRQREISVSEFFQKNRHLLGFDNPRKALLTAIKEAVDNALDACEEARILPSIVVVVKPTKSEDRFVISVQDNGPGIMPVQIPRIFGSLLYGSKFHRLKMSRGQQGIGISAAGMYGQLTTGKSVCITSKTAPEKPATYIELQINTTKNLPVVIKQEEIDWKFDRGTKVELEIVARYQKGRQSIDEYLEQTAIANPHAELVYHTPEGETRRFKRATNDLPVEPREIKPHPHGIELGMLIKMLKDSKDRTLTAFLHHSFSRVSTPVANGLAKQANIDPKIKPFKLQPDEVERLYLAINATKLMAPPTDCLAPIGEEQIKAGLKQIEADFYEAVTRSPSVYRGNPFLVEAGLAWGGKQQDAESLARVLRFANRVPLLYQQSACAIYDGIVETQWRNYHVQQSRGALPCGPMTLMIHFASAWVPFTSESKEAIADYPEITKEIRLALQELGRRLSLYLRRRRRQADAERRKSYITKYIPHIAIGLREILGFSEKEQERTEKRLRNLLESEGTNGNGDGAEAEADAETDPCGTAMVDVEVAVETADDAAPGTPVESAAVIEEPVAVEEYAAGDEDVASESAAEEVPPAKSARKSAATPAAKPTAKPAAKISAKSDAKPAAESANKAKAKTATRAKAAHGVAAGKE
jgi:DNA topoisomerase-6 subunit B